MPAFDGGIPGSLVLLQMILYALRLYADFTGGIDMALGVGELFGVVLPENFDRPYISKNIEDRRRRTSRPRR